MNTYINIRQQSNNRFMFFIIILVIIGVIGISIWFLSQRILQNPHAAASTTLSFDNPVQTVDVGQDITGNIIVDPGTNKVSLIKLIVTYDGSKIATGSGIATNASAFPTILDGPNYTCNNTDCKISMTVSVGSDPTKAIQTKTTVATLDLKAIDTTQNPVQVSFDPSTTVLSIASGDQAGENVLSSSTPLTITVNGSSGETPTPTPASCQMNISNCQWDPRPTATSYHYKITDVTSGNTIKEGDVDASQTQVDFPSQAGKTYSCTITAINACKSSNPKSATVTCPLPSVTPIPSVTPTPSICSGPGTVKNLHISCPDCAGSQ